MTKDFLSHRKDGHQLFILKITGVDDQLGGLEDIDTAGFVVVLEDR